MRKIANYEIKFRKTKTEFPICPYFIWESEHGSEESICVCFCNHSENPDEYEGNCQEKICPLLKETKEC